LSIQTLRLVAPSDATVTVELPADQRVTSVAAGVRFAGGSYGRGFQIGPRGHHDFACAHLVPASTIDRFVVHGREVVVAEAADKSTAIATLMGEYHELMTVFGGPAPQRSNIIQLFSMLEIDDRVGGMVVKPKSATLLGTLNEHLTVVVEGYGSLSIPGAGQAHNMLPKHRGAKTKKGEVWRTPLPGVTTQSSRARDYSYVLGFKAGLAEVHFDDGDTPGDDARLAWLDQINVAWQPN
jgi:hypothetical protein